jgi:hypothetical protein
VSGGVLRLADNLFIPIGKAMSERGGQRIAIIGKSGSGKTNTQQVTTKAWMENGWPVVIVDPMNGYRSLKHAGMPILIAGARASADLHLTTGNAGHLAEACFKQRLSVILELSMYEDGQDIEVLEAFLRPFWRQFLMQPEDIPHQPFGLVIDEAHLFAPQSGKTDVTHLINDMGKRGRQLGLSIIFSTQRPASIQKDFLLMSNMLIAHKVTFGDVGVVAEAISQPPSRVSPVIKRFKTGEAIVTGDADLLDTRDEDYSVVQIYKWEVTTNALSVTLDSTSRIKPIDPALIEQLQETMKRPARRDDSDKDRLIEQLRAEVERLKAELEQHQSVPVMEAVAQNGSAFVSPGAAQVSAQIQRIKPQLPIMDAPAPTTANPLLNSGMKRILQTLADIYPMLVTKTQLGTLADYTVSGGAFNANWSALKRFGFVVEDDLITITDAGFDYLGIQPRAIPNTKDELLAMWREVLKDKAWSILAFLIDAYPGWVYRERLAEAVTMTASGGAFNAYIGILRRNGLIESNKNDLRANGEMLLLEAVK